MIFIVIPCLAESGNFVIREEYPDAERSGKIMLPVIMEDVDMQIMKKYFPKFDGKYIRGYDPTALADALTDIREKLGKPYRDISPFQKFRLSLAYAEGTITDRNTELSLQLLKKAAEECDPNAMAKLGMKYHLGDGVEHDEENGIALNDKALDKLIEMYEAILPDSQEAFSVTNMINEVCDTMINYYIENQMNREHRLNMHIWEIIVTYRQNLNNCRRSGFLGRNRYNLGTLYVNGGRVLLYEHDYDEAKKSFEEAE